jgi:hypothetical protein
VSAVAELLEAGPRLVTLAELVSRAPAGQEPEPRFPFTLTGSFIDGGREQGGQITAVLELTARTPRVTAALSAQRTASDQRALDDQAAHGESEPAALPAPEPELPMAEDVLVDVPPTKRPPRAARAPEPGPIETARTTAGALEDLPARVQELLDQVLVLARYAADLEDELSRQREGMLGLQRRLGARRRRTAPTARREDVG